VTSDHGNGNNQSQFSSGYTGIGSHLSRKVKSCKGKKIR
jgi:hypothetical protein